MTPSPEAVKHPIKWKIYWWLTGIRDYGWPIITPLADFIRGKMWEWEDHKD